MGPNGCEEIERAPPITAPSNGLRVRDMVRRYDTAVKSDSTKTSYSSIVSAKSSYFGVNTNSNANNGNVSRNGSPSNESCSNSLIVGSGYRVQDLGGSPSRSSSGSRKTVRSSRSPRIETANDVQVSHLETQKSLMNLSRTREPPKAAPREKKPRHSAPQAAVPVLAKQRPQPQQDEHLNVTDSSYQSKTTISKTPNGVRIIIDIFFDQNKGLAIEDVVGSRVETDIPPSKILAEFQKRVADAAPN